MPKLRCPRTSKFIISFLCILIIISVSPVVLSMPSEWEYPISGDVNAISISLDGSYITIGDGGSLQILGIDGKKISQNVGNGTLNSVSASSNYVASGNNLGDTCLYDKFGSLKYCINTGTDIKLVSVSNNGNVATSKEKSGRNWVEFLDKSGKSLWELKAKDEAKALSVSPDGKYIATTNALKGEQIKVDHDMKTGERFEYAVEEYLTYSVGLFSDDGILIWSSYIGSDISSIATADDGNYVVASSEDNVYFFDRNGYLQWTWSNPSYNSIEHVNLFSGGSGDEYIAAISGNTRYIINQDGTLIDTWKIDSSIKLGAIYSEKTVSKLVSISGNKVTYYEYDFDYDKDGMSNDEEMNIGTDPKNRDTDDDGLIDSEDPHPLEHEDARIDSDNDGLNNLEERQKGTDPFNKDSDGDGYNDDDDSNPLINDVIDSDNDGWTDVFESKMGTDPDDSDTDGDGEIDSLDSSPGSMKSKGSGFGGLLTKLLALLGI